MVEVMKTMSPPLKGPMQALLHSVPPTLQPATAGPHVCQRLLDTHGPVWVSLVGSLLLSPGPGCTRLCLCLQESVSPGLCRVWWLYGGLKATSSNSLFPQACVSSGSSVVR